MTTRPDHHKPLDAEPLSDEERDLAARLGRVALDGPSPALDAKILAAAHAAAATRVPSRRHRIAWLGVPPALVTGMGVAAAAVLALGLVWQLRPHYSGTSVQSEGVADEEVILIAPPSDSAQAARAPALPETPASTAPATSAPKPVQPMERVADAPAMQSAQQAPAPAPAPAATAEASGLLGSAAAPAEAKREADAVADTAASDDGFVAEPSDAANATARKNHATYTTAARATAERRERSAAAQVAAAPAAEQAGTELDTIVVTGTRVKPDVAWSQIPVSEDTHLAAVDWLERIRARRDDGDTDDARASLRLFQREYPRIRLPDDLRALLADAKR